MAQAKELRSKLKKAVGTEAHLRIIAEILLELLEWEETK